MSDDQMKVEVDWCLARLEEKMFGIDPFSRPAQEAAKVHRILKSSKAPVVKKRQAMRNMFGDYREKMKAMEKKNVAAMKKSKLVAVKETPTESKFLRLSTGAADTLHQSQNAANTAADSLQQLSVGGATPSGGVAGSTTNGGGVLEAGTSAAGDASGSDFKFGFDGSEKSGVVGDASASSDKDAVPVNYFVMKPSNEDFRFNFSSEESAQAT